MTERYMDVRHAQTIIDLYGGPCICEPCRGNPKMLYHHGSCEGPCFVITKYDAIGHVSSGYGMCVVEGGPGWEECDLSWKLPEARLALCGRVQRPRGAP